MNCEEALKNVQNNLYKALLRQQTIPLLVEMWLTSVCAGIQGAKGFAVDWVSGNMYFTSYDRHKATLSVAQLNGAYRTVLKKWDRPQGAEGRQAPIEDHSLAVHPMKG